MSDIPLYYNPRWGKMVALKKEILRSLRKGEDVTIVCSSEESAKDLFNRLVSLFTFMKDLREDLK